jgi:small-conductance mechanosensitive channel
LPAGVPVFEPFVRFTEFGDSSVNFNTILRVNEVVDQHLLRHEFVMRLHKRFALEDIEIPFPQRVIHSSDES